MSKSIMGLSTYVAFNRNLSPARVWAMLKEKQIEIKFVDRVFPGRNYLEPSRAIINYPVELKHKGESIRVSVSHKASRIKGMPCEYILTMTAYGEQRQHSTTERDLFYDVALMALKLL